MKIRMVKPGERYRFMARSSNPHTLSRLENLMAAEGYKRVKFLSPLPPQPLPSATGMR